MTVGAVVVLSRGWRSQKHRRKQAAKFAIAALAAYFATSLIAHVGGLPMIWPLQHPIFILGIWSLSIVLTTGIASFRTQLTTPRAIHY
jgi:hypothetical protein